MNLEEEIVCKIMEDAVSKVFVMNDFSITVQEKSVEILEKIRRVICNNKLSDFEMIEELVEILNSYGINTGSCHDF